jgi:hypothetical protein
MGWVVNATPRLLYPRERDPVPIVQEAGWAPGPVWTVAENLAPTGILTPDHPARSESLYRLSYAGSRNYCTKYNTVSNENENGYLSSDNLNAVPTVSASKSAPSRSFTPLPIFTVRLRQLTPSPAVC